MATEITRVKTGVGTIIAEYDEEGRTRLRCGQSVGEWAKYSQPAFLVLGDGEEIFMLLTEYWAGTFPPRMCEKILQITEAR